MGAREKIHWRVWTEADIEQLIELYSSRRSVGRIAAEIDRTAPATAMQLCALRKAGRIGRPGRLREWEAGEDDYLIDQYRPGHVKALAEHLDRSVDAVEHRLRGLRKSGRLKPYRAPREEEIPVVQDVRPLDHHVPPIPSILDLMRGGG